MGIFQKKDRTQKLIEEEILFAIAAERMRLEDTSTSYEEDETHCKNIKHLAEAFAAVNGR